MHEPSGMSLWRHRSKLTETFCSWRAAALQRPDSRSFSFVSLPLVRWFRQVRVPCQDWLKCSLAILCRVSSCEYNEQRQHRTCVSKQEHDSQNWKPRSLVSIFSFFFYYSPYKARHFLREDNYPWCKSVVVFCKNISVDTLFIRPAWKRVRAKCKLTVNQHYFRYFEAEIKK